MKIGSGFSGIGAWEKAFDVLKIDYKLEWFFENDEHVATAYCAIHNINKNLNKGDIAKAKTQELDDIDVFVYSPPCQAFSVAGKQMGFEDERGVLFFDALKIIKTKKPKYALMENVKGLTQKTFDKEFKVILNRLEQEGYKNYWKILDARNFGIPQNRERVFIISIRKDIDKEFVFPKPITTTLCINKILEPDAKLPILHNIYGGFKEKKPRIFNEYSPTIRTSAGGGHIPSVCTTDRNKTEKVVAGYQTRKLTPLECWRLMGFSDEDYWRARQALEYKYYNGKNRSNTKMYKMAGNSIVVDVLVHIYKNLFKEYI